jgi:hypothetical protein
LRPIYENLALGKNPFRVEPKQHASYLERGRIDHLASSIGKSHARAMAAVCLLPILMAYEDERFSNRSE